MIKTVPQVHYHNNIAYHLWQPAQRTNGQSRQAIFFSHATGIPTQTYKELFTTLVNQLDVIVVAVDLPGFGESSDQNLKFQITPELWINLGNSHAEYWAIAKAMVKEHLHILEELQWTFAGHSLGAWLSIWAALKTKQLRVIALDLVWLPPVTASIWALASLLGLRAHHPIGKKSLNRRTQFNTAEDAFKQFQKQRFFQGWSAAAIQLYIAALFKESSGGTVLKHLPSQEAAMFFGQPRSTTKLFKKFPETERESLQVVFVAGDASDTCDPKGFKRFQAIFPKSREIIVPDEGHMFPISNPQATLNIIKGILQPDSQY